MVASQGSVVDLEESDEHGGRKFLSPTRILARSFRLSRDNWRQKHGEVQKKLEQERQLSAERDRSRDQWRKKCEAATSKAAAAERLAQQRLADVEATQARISQLEADFKKKR